MIDGEISVTLCSFTCFFVSPFSFNNIEVGDCRIPSVRSQVQIWNSRRRKILEQFPEHPNFDTDLMPCVFIQQHASVLFLQIMLKLKLKSPLNL